MKLAKKTVAAVLGWQVRRLRRKHNFQIVAVAGSVGKTSTKLAIVKVLQQKYRAQFQDGNYNDLVSVPLIFFGQVMPSLFNPLAWLKIFWENERLLRQPYPYDIVVIELGTDAPGQMKAFRSYVEVDVGVLTAIVQEHMEFFDGLDSVAKEELILNDLSQELIVNRDFCPAKYLDGLKNKLITYGIKQAADFRMVDIEFNDFESSFSIRRNQSAFLQTSHEFILEPQLYSVTAATAVGAELGMSAAEIEKGIHEIRPVNGRMQHLKGVKNSTIIDDTYNASPEAMKAALDTLYRLDAPQKIALLGNMNELGKYSEHAHKEVGNYCDPKKLDLVVTIGSDANRFLAPTAELKGCKVEKFDNPISAGKFIKSAIKEKGLILAKGSQNGVFAEEAVKQLLVDSDDYKKLVRQTPYWMKQKQSTLKA